MAQITRKFNNTPLTEALRTIEQGQSEYTIAVLADGLADLRTYANVKNLSVPDAVKLVCKGLPVKVKVNGSKISVQRKGEKAKKKGFVNKAATIQGFVRDRITNENLTGTKVSLMKGDSIIAMATANADWSWLGRSGLWFFNLTLDSCTDYTLLFERDGYNVLSWPLSEQLKKKPLKKGESRFIGDVPMDKTPKTHVLNGVTIKATKVKFYHKGDTLVYDADAFQLAEGSMLDGLIKQLPGAELNENGEIFVNGRKVQSLMLNGEDFFKGKNNIMLENLPAYMVKTIKAYDKEGPMSRMAGRDMGDKEFVMDVGLKKQFLIGWIGNVEAGYGSEERYLARLFALRFSPRTRISLYGNMNNLNDTRKPGEGSNWTPESMPSGLLATKKFGADMLLKFKDGTNKWESNAELTYTDLDSRTETTGETYLADGNVFTRGKSTQAKSNLTFTNTHKIELSNKTKSLFADFYPNFSYRKVNSIVEGVSMSFNRKPEVKSMSELIDSVYHGIDSEFSRTIINRNINNSKRDYHRLDMEMTYKLYYKMTPSSHIMFDQNISYNSEQDDSWRQMQTEYPNNSAVSSDTRNRYSTSNPNKNFNINSVLTYIRYLRGNTNIRFFYEVDYKRNHTDYATYMLDKLADWDNLETHQIGMLPSESEYAETFDRQNSYNQILSNTTQTPKMALVNTGYYGKGDSVKGKSPNRHYRKTAFTLPIAFSHDRLDYIRAAYSGVTKRNNIFFNPDIYQEFHLNNMESSVKLEYNITHVAPSMVYALNIRTDEDPLNIYYGNPHLKNTTIHNVNVEYVHRNAERQHNYWLTLKYDISHNSVAMGYIYDRATGIRTYTPANVSGNYNLVLNTGYSCSLDKKKYVTLDNYANWRMSHGVDLIGTDTGEAPERSSVMTHWITDRLRIDYRISKNFKLGAKGYIGIGHTSSSREDFQSLTLYDFHYGLTALINLPAAFQLSTDLTMYSRRGYASSSANTNDLVWNARLSKTFTKAGLTFALDAFDILGNLSNISQVLNSQGRTETYRNSLPRYIMAHVIYRLNKKPKKNGKEAEK
ncbi:MAG: outer membrane beta-barrel protein [Bacteroidaceae bacterium]|nr:outer membrane beta-barrel protein [Bacteroidaceae bacterium]